MSKIIVFRSNEVPKLNYQEIQILFSELGYTQAVSVFERVLFEVSDRLCQIELAVYEGDVALARKRSSNLRALSPQIGLDCLSGVAGDMIEAIDNDNLGALPAICHRMVCLGEVCLFQLSELPRALSEH